MPFVHVPSGVASLRGEGGGGGHGGLQHNGRGIARRPFCTRTRTSRHARAVAVGAHSAASSVTGRPCWAFVLHVTGAGRRGQWWAVRVGVTPVARARSRGGFARSAHPTSHTHPASPASCRAAAFAVSMRWASMDLRMTGGRTVSSHGDGMVRTSSPLPAVSGCLTHKRTCVVPARGGSRSPIS